MAVSPRSVVFAVSTLACLSTACVKPGVQDARSVGVHRAPGAPASHYRESAPGPAAFVGAAASAPLSAAIESVARGQRSALIGDARLAVLARFVLDGVTRDVPSAPSLELVDFVLRHVGSYDAEPEVVVLDLPVDGAAQALQAGLAARLSAGSFTHYGAASVAKPGGTRLVVVLAERGVVLAPVARSVVAGATLRLSGRLLAGASRPRVEISSPGSRAVALDAGPGPELDVELPIAQRGVHRVDVLGDDAFGTTTLARMTIYAGIDPPVTLSATQSAGGVDEAVVRRELLARINDDRARAGRAALVQDATLDRIAQRHSAEMRDQGFVGHASSRSGGPAERVARAGMQGRLVLENIVRGDDAVALHVNTMTQPDLQQNALHADATHVGLGVVRLTGAAGTGTLLMTQLFTGAAQRIDGAALSAQLLSAINAARASRGAAPLALVAELSEVAERASRRFVEGVSVSEREVVEAANAELQTHAATYRSVSTLLVLARRASDVTVPEAALDPALAALGLAVAQGSRADRNGQLLVAAFVLALPR
jgi:uncharacterized protein YkwD